MQIICKYVHPSQAYTHNLFLYDSCKEYEEGGNNTEGGGWTLYAWIYMLNLVSGELEGLPVVSGSPLLSGGS
jgi:hypothetical protein